MNALVTDFEVHCVIASTTTHSGGSGCCAESELVIGSEAFGESVAEETANVRSVP